MRLLPLALRTALTVLIVAGILCILGFLGYKLAVEPQITITAPAGSVVRLIDMRNGAQVAQTTVDGSSATLSAGVGSYEALVDTKNGSQIFYTQTALLKRV